ncbi:hypothetical protein ABTE13_20345, partial [Acinetobacter baumannii]
VLRILQVEPKLISLSQRTPEEPDSGSLSGKESDPQASGLRIGAPNKFGEKRAGAAHRARFLPRMSLRTANLVPKRKMIPIPGMGLS